MPPARSPWPMKWIVLAIAVFIALYTFLTLHFRKPGPGYEPYQDAKHRAQLFDLGYHRLTLRVDRPADPRPIVAEAPVRPAPGGLPADLVASLLPAPRLPAAIGAVAAAPVAGPGYYHITFACTRDDRRQDFAAAALYVKGGEIYVVTDCELLAEGLLTRSQAEVIELSFDSAKLDPGAYHVTLAGARASQSWTVQVH